MHPLIAFLAFIFSPSDDWLLKRAYQLVIDPAHIEMTVADYQRLEKVYPSRYKLGNGREINTDLAAEAVFAEVLLDQGRKQEALALYQKIEKDKRLPDELTDDVNLRIGETELALGQETDAENRFNQLAAKPLNPRRIDAEVDLLICELAKGDGPAALQRANNIRTYAEREPLSFRAALPMGLADFAAGRYEDAVTRLGQVEHDPRARYFQGMALRRLNRPSEEVAQWQELRNDPDKSWAALGELQLAEAYFALGDDGLSRQVAERALAKAPGSAVAPELQFRLASIDFRAGKFDDALKKLDPLLKNDGLSQRATVLLAESLAKTGRSKDLFATLARMPTMRKSAEGVYQTAWAAMIEKRFEEAIGTADRGLRGFRDADFTPRLLLLQGLAFEYLGKTAEALATYQTIVDRFPETPAAAYSAHWTTMAYLRLNRPMEAATHGAYLFAQVPDAIQRQVPDAAFWIGEAHLRMKRWDDADKAYARFIDIADPSNERVPNAIFQRTVTLAQLNRPAEALAMLEMFRRRAQDDKKPELVQLAWLQQGNILFNDRQYVSAVEAYRAAGDQPKAQYQQALALYHLDYITDAVETWTRLADARPQDPWGEKACFRAARATFELGKSTAAVAAFAKFIERYPNSPDVKIARLQSAHALYNAGDVAAALPLYTDYLSRYHETDDLAEVTPYLASCLAQTGKSAAEAELAMKDLPPEEGLALIEWTEGAKDFNGKAYEQASDRFGTLAFAMPAYDNTSPALFYRAESLYQQQRWFEAEGAYNSFLGMKAEADRDPGQAATALFHRGVAAFNRDRLLDAAASFADVAHSYPTSPLARDAETNLVLCYHALGDFSTAEKFRAQYGLPAAGNGPPSQTPDFSTTVDGQPASHAAPSPTSRRGVTEIPRDLSFRQTDGEAAPAATAMAANPDEASTTSP